MDDWQKTRQQLDFIHRTLQGIDRVLWLIVILLVLLILAVD